MGNTYVGSDWINDTLYYTNEDTVFGLNGHDKLSAGKMFGGLGNDTYAVDSANDLVFEEVNQGTDRVISLISEYTLTSNVENLTLTNFTFGGRGGLNWQNGTGNGLANIISGNNLTNVISGEGGADILFAGGGHDFVLGGAGQDNLYGTDTVTRGAGEIDILTGGTDADTFWLGSPSNNVVFYTASGNNDYARITDFEINVDKIVLDGSADKYYLGANSGSVEIYYKTFNGGGSSGGELIGSMQGAGVNIQTVSLDNSNMFIFG